jgi:hypothetical protein
MMSAWSLVGGLLFLVPMSDIWVDAIGGSPTGDGASPSTAFQLITQGINAASSGDVIKVKKGVYDVAWGETFPLSPGDGVTLLGVDSGESLEDFARIGGDISDPDVSALLLLEDRSGVTVQGFVFLGQDEENFDSPSAAQIIGDSDDCAIVGNICERGEMNDATHADRATIVLGGVPSAISECSIESNVIDVTIRGAIEVQGTAAGETTMTGLIVSGNVIQNRTETIGEFGFRWSGLDGRLGGQAQIRGNQIVSSDSGIGVGIDVEITRFGSLSSTFHVSQIDANLIQGCYGDGVVLSADDSANLTISSFARNIIWGNGGSGVHVIRDPDRDDNGAGYVHVDAEGNLIVGNAGAAYTIDGLGPDSSGSSKWINDTLADNGGPALDFANWIDSENLITGTLFDTLFPKVMNDIFRGNNAESYAQVTGLSEGLLSVLLSRTSYTHWQNLPGSPANGNSAADPEFEDAPNGDYHLASGSPCIDSGRIAGTTAIVDIDREDRVQDGDFSCTGSPVPQIDRGADEATEPDCP